MRYKTWKLKCCRKWPEINYFPQFKLIEFSFRHTNRILYWGDDHEI